jgi:ketopantoate reductase
MRVAMIGAGAMGGVHGVLLFLPFPVFSARYPALARDQQQQQHEQQVLRPEAQYMTTAGS